MDFMETVWFFNHFPNQGQRYSFFNYCTVCNGRACIITNLPLEATSKWVYPLTCWTFKLILKLSFFARYMKWSFPLATFITCCTVIRSFRVSHKNTSILLFLQCFRFIEWSWKKSKTNASIVWKLPKMSHFNFFCPFKTDMAGNTVWPQAILALVINFCPLKM